MAETLSPVPVRESHAGVLGLATGILLIAGAAAALLVRRESFDVEPGAVFEQAFGDAPAELPGGYVLLDASRPGDGTRVARWTLGGVVPEVPPDEKGSHDTKAGAVEEREKVHWLTGAPSERDAPPAALHHADAPRRLAKKLFERYFRDLPQRGVDDLGEEGGNVVIESGSLDWHGLDADFVRQRKFEKREGALTFTDTLRVNLTRDRACMLIASWPPGSEGSVGALRAVLEALPASVE